MGKLTRLETKTRALVKGLFAKGEAWPGPQAVTEAAVGLIESGLVLLDGSSLRVAPDLCRIILSQAECAASSGLAAEVQTRLRSHVESRGYLTARTIEVEVVADSGQVTGQGRISVLCSMKSPCLRLRISEEPEGRVILVEPGRAISIGREDSNDFVTDVPQVSSRHARLELSQDGAIHLTDLGSSNGTFVKGRRIRKTVLKSGEKFQLGRAGAVLLRVELAAIERPTSRDGRVPG